MKRRILFSLLVIGLASAGFYAIKVNLPERPSLATVKPQELPLLEYMQKLMDECGAKQSEAMTRVLSNQVATTARDTFANRDEQEAAGLLVCIESKFNPKAKSPSNAIGLTQVLPQFAGEFAEACGLGKLVASDLEYPEVNLRVGFCQFRRLLQIHNGSIPLALAAYNSGANSPSVKRLAGLGAGNPETDSYLAKFSVIKDKMKRSKPTE